MCKPQNQKGAGWIEVYHPQKITPILKCNFHNHAANKEPTIKQKLTAHCVHIKVWVYYVEYLHYMSFIGLIWLGEMFFPVSTHLSVTQSLHLSPGFSLRKTKNRSSHSDREQRKTWPRPVTFGASWLVEAHCVSFVAVWTLRQAVLWALPWTQSHLSNPVRADLHRRLRALEIEELRHWGVENDSGSRDSCSFE